MLNETRELRVSEMAENLSGSEIIKLAAEVNARKNAGENIYNLTIGDFDPKVFPIPSELKESIINAYRKDETNYPPAAGIPALRKAVSAFHRKYQGLDYPAEDFLIAGGARPLIYAVYQTLLDPGDKVIFPVPSWNNNHYCHLTTAEQIMVETRPENSFMPMASEMEPFIEDASMIALCSPLNPTGTTFSEEQLRSICELVIKENERRDESQKPLYLMYDQIYWTLTYGSVKHFDPVSLYPELRPFVVYIDGLSKAFAATGVRVGWAFGPKHILSKMASILGHVGAWAPKAEQVAVAEYLADHEKTEQFLKSFRAQLALRLEGFYKGFIELKSEGYDVNAIAPAAAIYLTVQFNLHGAETDEGKVLRTTRDITGFLLEKAGIALVPFYAFGASESSTWYRLSVGTVRENEISEIIASLRGALRTLKK